VWAWVDLGRGASRAFKAPPLGYKIDDYNAYFKVVILKPRGPSLLYSLSPTELI